MVWVQGSIARYPQLAPHGTLSVSIWLFSVRTSPFSDQHGLVEKLQFCNFGVTSHNPRDPWAKVG